MAHPQHLERKVIKRPVQLELRARSWGGPRPGSGRKPGPVRLTPHRTRPPLASRFPVHVTLKVDDSLPDLRDDDIAFHVEQCLSRGKGGERFRLVHYSFMTHHLHLIVEAADVRALTAGIRGLSIRLARRLNKITGRSGRVFVDRYFARILRTPREVRNAIGYVLLNVRKHAAQHGRKLLADWIDQCSSARFFDGWRESRNKLPPDERPTVVPAGTWLLRKGWRRWGLLRVDEIPGGPVGERSVTAPGGDGSPRLARFAALRQGLRFARSLACGGLLTKSYPLSGRHGCPIASPARRRSGA